MQPTYLPWAGYFNLLWQADRFVFLDDVQFERQSWQCRNRILLNGEEHLLVVPVKREGLGAPISQAVISTHNNWRQNHWRTLVSAYAKAAHGREALDLLQPFYEGDETASLSALNRSIILALTEALGIHKNVVLASELGCEGARSVRLANICWELNCDEYLSPIGSKDYLREDNFEILSNVRLSFQEFTPFSYPQYRSKSFVPRLSVIDVIANMGIGYASAYISGNPNAS
jgi:hypothetical protein